MVDRKRKRDKTIGYPIKNTTEGCIMKLSNKQYALVFTLEDNEQGLWTGDVDISAYYDDDNGYDKKTHDQMFNMITLLTTCVNLLETDDNFLKSVWKHRTKLDRIYDELAELEETEKKVSRKPEVLKKEGNVYRLNFATPSDGEA